MDTIYDAKLLLVDDNAELLALLCEQLRGAGYCLLKTAQSCAAARAWSSIPARPKTSSCSLRRCLSWSASA